MEVVVTDTAETTEAVDNCLMGTPREKGVRKTAT